MLGEFAILVKGNRMEAVAVKTNTDKIHTTPGLIALTRSFQKRAISRLL